MTDRASVHTNLHTHTCIHTRTHTHTHTHTITHMDTHTHTHMHLHTYTQTCTHAQIYGHIHTHTHVWTHTHTHTHTHILFWAATKHWVQVIPQVRSFKYSTNTVQPVILPHNQVLLLFKNFSCHDCKNIKLRVIRNGGILVSALHMYLHWSSFCFSLSTTCHGMVADGSVGSGFYLIGFPTVWLGSVIFLSCYRICPCCICV